MIDPGQSRLGSDGNEGVLYIPKSSKRASPSDSSMSYPEHLLGESYPSAEMQLVYSTAPADWAQGNSGLYSKLLHSH